MLEFVQLCEINSRKTKVENYDEIFLDFLDKEKSRCVLGVLFRHSLFDDKIRKLHI